MKSSYDYFMWCIVNEVSDVHFTQLFKQINIRRKTDAHY